MSRRVKSLQEISLDSINSNIDLILKYCQKFDWKIPKIVGDKLLRNLTKQHFLLSEKSMKIFYENIIEFTSFTTGRQFFSISDFKFLHGRKLKNLKLHGIRNICYDFQEYPPISTDNLYVNSVKLLNFDLAKMVNFFQYSLLVKDSIYIENMKNGKFFRALLNLIENSSQTLKILSFRNCRFYKGFKQNLASAMSKVSSLESLTIYSDEIFRSLPRFFIANAFKASYNSLKVLDILGFDCSSSAVVEILHKLNPLEKFSVDIASNEYSLLQILKDKHSSSLRKLHIYFSNLSKKSLIELGICLKKCNNLVDILVILGNSEEKELENVLAGLKYCAENLEAFHIGPHINITDGIANKWKDILLRCKSLQKMSLNCFKNTSGLLHFFKKTISNCKHTLQHFSLENVDSQHLSIVLPALFEVNNLKTLNIDCYPTMESIQILIDIISYHFSNLEGLYLTDDVFRIDDKHRAELARNISHCPNLKTLSLGGYRYIDELHLIFNPSSKFLENLEVLIFKKSSLECPKDSIVWKALNQCKNLRRINLWDTFISFDTLEYLFEQLKPARYTFEEFQSPGITENEMDKATRRLLKSFFFVRITY